MTRDVTPNCGKCGLCLAVCPVYAVLKEELVSPRAKLQLIKAVEDKNLLSSPRIKSLVSKCLMCGRCSALCPSGINHYAKFMDMRRIMVKDHGEAVSIKSLIYLLSREYRLSMAAGMGCLGQAVIPKRFKEIFHLGNINLEKFPEFNRKPFRSQVPDVIAPTGHEKGTVIYFTGCATNYLYEDTGMSVLSILNHMGYRVLIPKHQTCCAIPMLFHGAVEKAADSVKTNIRALTRTGLENVDAVIVDCLTCGTALKQEWGHLCDDLGLDRAGANEISAKVQDIVSFILARFDDIELKFRGDDDPVRVTYHPPCHLKNPPGTPTPLEKLLGRIPHIDYVKAPGTDDCCGGGGTFFYEYPEISRKMIEKKIGNLRTAKAGFCLTDCPVCRINLSGNLPATDSPGVIHPAGIIARFLKR
ncbi:MAG: (Fe-S)-binding protein [Pseudomonadota bacterium]